jgi:hypothetical protein
MGNHLEDMTTFKALSAHMLTTSRLTPAQRRIREARRTPPPDPERIAQHRIQFPRVRESVLRLPDRH